MEVNVKPMCFAFVGNVLNTNKCLHVLLLIQIVVKLADFGLSKTVDRSQAKTYCGTMYYLAPEIIKAYQLRQKYTEKVRKVNNIKDNYA